MTRLQHIKKRVETILQNDFEARDDDRYLYYLVCKQICEEQGFDVDALSFRSVMMNKEIVLPNTESVRRCRQKLQEENENLWGVRREERMQLQGEYIDFVRE